jgi:hypothetical protein
VIGADTLAKPLSDYISKPVGSIRESVRRYPPMLFPDIATLEPIKVFFFSLLFIFIISRAD